MNIKLYRYNPSRNYSGRGLRISAVAMAAIGVNSWWVESFGPHRLLISALAFVTLLVMAVAAARNGDALTILIVGAMTVLVIVGYTSSDVQEAVQRMTEWAIDRIDHLEWGGPP